MPRRSYCRSTEAQHKGQWGQRKGWVGASRLSVNKGMHGEQRVMPSFAGPQSSAPKGKCAWCSHGTSSCSGTVLDTNTGTCNASPPTWKLPPHGVSRFTSAVTPPKPLPAYRCVCAFVACVSIQPEASCASFLSLLTHMLVQTCRSNKDVVGLVDS
jgi:hypothetical protein